MKKDISTESAPRFISMYQDNLDYLEQIKLLGSSSR